MHFRVNTPPVIHQTLDGEVIVVNLDTGTYYSITGSGTQIWTALLDGVSSDAVAAAARQRYAATPDAEEAVRAFVELLVDEQLLAPAAATAASEPSEVLAGSADFAPPRLERYTDMQELLMLDPIHDVDEQGWPNRIEAGQAGGA
jgi:hypothetical protein